MIKNRSKLLPGSLREPSGSLLGPLGRQVGPKIAWERSGDTPETVPERPGTLAKPVEAAERLSKRSRIDF